MPTSPASVARNAVETHVALLRAINVGGRHMLPMPQLAALFAAAGCREIRTHLQSGNVVFQAPAGSVEPLSGLIAGQISVRFGFDVPVLLRSRDELAALVVGNPFLEAGADPAALHVMFLADRPSSDRVARLDPDRSPTDAFAVRGREVFLHCPQGLARTKLTNAYFERHLATPSTVRNWRTVLKLLELAAGPLPSESGEGA